MNNKKVFLIILLAFVLLLAGAYVLYDRLGDKVETNQLAVNTPQPTAEATSAPSEEEPEEETEEEADANVIYAPDFTVYDIDGNAVNLSDYFGKPIVLNFWASWCGPCKSEMPDFDAACADLDGAVQFMMINVTDGGRETVETASAYVEAQGFTFPVFYDTELDAAYVYGASSLPATYFIDAEGYAVARAVGAIDAATLQTGIDMILPQ